MPGCGFPLYRWTPLLITFLLLLQIYWLLQLSPNAKLDSHGKGWEWGTTATWTPHNLKLYTVGEPGWNVTGVNCNRRLFSDACAPKFGKLCGIASHTDACFQQKPGQSVTLCKNGKGGPINSPKVTFQNPLTSRFVTWTRWSQKLWDVEMEERLIGSRMREVTDCFW